ncbi:PTPLA-domain-containing protein [Polyporus arcularius HHB13444]|uniref:Very-long-chain (3R)-3-hydroxyacyl-CoA dehydratase n=1 Tax=Polyporus arcularius HHB13444 TaxID=1314778 RepID=A0A5C3NY24_9APHY|nr:PTPLA-domain-containing protein [Polyporus arcularius HHB13444]
MAFVEEVKAEKPLPAVPKTKRDPSTLVKYYLVLYNILSTLGWSYLLLRTLTVVLNLDGSKLRPSSLVGRAAGAYAEVGADTAIVQSFAVLEVLHVLLGWVRSPLSTTLIQVSSRLYLVWGITGQFSQTHTNPFYASMVLSWALTEVVRYSYYACSLLGHESRLLVFLRYTLFYILYPTGASSEAFLIYATLPHPAFGLHADLHTNVRELLFAIWWPGLYVMYTHMIKQRRKVLGGSRPAGRTGAKSKSS